MCRRRPGGGRWEVHGALGSRSSAVIDLDRDGDLDIVTHDFNSPPQVLISDLAQRGPVSRIELELSGTRSNRDGLGALVRVVTAERVLTRWINGRSGYLSQGSFPLYVGLGAASQVDAIEVACPSGCDQRVEGPWRSGSAIEIEESCAETGTGG